MSKTAEERAKALVEECRAFDSQGDILFIASDRAETLITAAIREAENAVIERARREILMTSLANGETAHDEFINGLAAAKDRILALRHPEEGVRG